MISEKYMKSVIILIFISYVQSCFPRPNWDSSKRQQPTIDTGVDKEVDINITIKIEFFKVLDITIFNRNNSSEYYSFKCYEPTEKKYVSNILDLNCTQNLDTGNNDTREQFDKTSMSRVNINAQRVSIDKEKNRNCSCETSDQTLRENSYTTEKNNIYEDNVKLSKYLKYIYIIILALLLIVIMIMIIKCICQCNNT